VSRTLCSQIGATWTGTCLMMVLVFCLPTGAEAGLVYGRVYGAEGEFEPGDAFTLIISEARRIEVKTDKFKGYSISIAPGMYDVEFTKNKKWKAVIQSYPQPVRQDIHLKEAK